MNLLSVKVANKQSKSACTLDASYGLTINRRAVWVNGGCRALFLVTGTLAEQPRRVNVECSSNNYRPSTCRPAGAGKLLDVHVVQKKSRSACTPNVSYGITADGTRVWVNHGCRAIFVATIA